MAEQMTTLNETEARANSATAGPWIGFPNATRGGVAYKPTLHSVDSEKERICPCCGQEDGTFVISDDVRMMADAEFIAHARADVPLLIRAVRQLDIERKVNRKLFDAVDNIWLSPSLDTDIRDAYDIISGTPEPDDEVLALSEDADA